MKTEAELIAELIAASDELYGRGVSAMAVLRDHIAPLRHRDSATGRIVSTIKNTAPLQKSSGAPVAQIRCATGESALQVKPSGAKCATAALPVAQQQQAGVFPIRADTGPTPFRKAQK